MYYNSYLITINFCNIDLVYTVMWKYMPKVGIEMHTKYLYYYTIFISLVNENMLVWSNPVKQEAAKEIMGEKFLLQD